MRLLLLACLWPFVGHTYAQTNFSTRFPLKASANGHYAEDQQGNPFLMLADTPWTLFYSWSGAELDTYLSERKKQGFNTLLVQVLTYNDTLRTENGLHPLNRTKDLAQRNEAFFKRMDLCLQKAGTYGFAVMLAPAWLSCCEPAWRDGLAKSGKAKAREFGRFLGQRYRHEAFPNVVGWIHGGDANPNDEMDEVQALAEGIQAEEGTYPRLHTGHWRSPYSTRDQTPEVGWLNLNATYCYDATRTDVGLAQNQIYANSIRDYQRIPAQPFFLIESQYEDPDSTLMKNGALPYVLRRQAWWSVLSGSTGVVYGSANCCSQHPKWQSVLTMPVARQMHILRDVLEPMPWTTLVPDGLPDPKQPANHKLVSSGYGTYYAYAGPAKDVGSDYVTAAATPDRRQIVAYVPHPDPVPNQPAPNGIRSLTLNLGPRPYKARWIDPTTGNARPVPGAKADQQILTTPGKNAGGDTDWVLLMELY